MHEVSDEGEGFNHYEAGAQAGGGRRQGRDEQCKCCPRAVCSDSKMQRELKGMKHVTKRQPLLSGAQGAAGYSPVR